jgi:hypothetical protein
MPWQSSKANPILSETTDCIQSTDYLHTKPDLLANWRKPSLTVVPPTACTTKGVATLQVLRSYKTREMACDMHEEKAEGVHHEENLCTRSIWALLLQQS